MKEASKIQLNELLIQLANCQRYRPSQFLSLQERTSGRFSNWLLGTSGGLLVLSGMLAIFITLFPPANCLRVIGVVLAVGSQLAALASMSVPPLFLLLSAARWKAASLTTLLREIEKDRANAVALKTHTDEVLGEAEYWLQLKLARIERQIGRILGEKTAALSLIALAVPLIKDRGTLQWIEGVFSDGIGNSPWKMAGVCFFAFFLGISLAAMARQVQVAWYKYQLELVGLARREYEAPAKDQLIPVGMLKAPAAENRPSA